MNVTKIPLKPNDKNKDERSSRSRGRKTIKISLKKINQHSVANLQVLKNRLEYNTKSMGGNG